MNVSILHLLLNILSTHPCATQSHTQIYYVKRLMKFKMYCLQNYYESYVVRNNNRLLFIIEKFSNIGEILHL